MLTIGSRKEVMNGLAKKTSGGLIKNNLKYNKQRKIVSKKLSELAIKNYRLAKTSLIKGGRKTKVIKLNRRSLEAVDDTNSYVYIGHGSKTNKKYIELGKNQTVILLCDNNKCYYSPSNHGSWDYIFNSSIEQFKVKLLNSEYFKKDHKLCIYKNKVPDINLFSFQQNSPYWRSGLYKLPLEYSINENKKENFLKKTLKLKHKINPKISIHNVSRKRPYVNINSYHKYNNIEYNTLSLKDVIDDLKDKPFTLYLFTCRT